MPQNSSVRCIENPQVKKIIEMLCLDYTPPSTLLDEIYEEEKQKCFQELSGKSVCVAIDGQTCITNQ